MVAVEKDIYSQGGSLPRQKTVPVRRMMPVDVGGMYQIRPVEIDVSPQMAALYKNHPDKFKEVDLHEAVYAGDADPELQLNWFKRMLDEKEVGVDLAVRVQINNEEFVLYQFEDDLVEGGSDHIVEMVVVKRVSDNAYAGLCLRRDGSSDILVGGLGKQDEFDIDPHVWLRAGWEALQTLDQA